MKKALIFSIIVHIILFSLAFLLTEEKKEKQRKPFFAEIVSPEDLIKGEQPVVSGKQKGSESPADTPRRALSSPKQQTTKKPAPKQEFAMKTPGSTPDRKPLKPAPQDTSRLPQSQAPLPKPPSAGSPGADRLSPSAGIPASPGDRDSSAAPPQKPREKIFDRDILAKLSETRREDVKPDSPITFDTKEFRYFGYMQRLKEKIEGIWRYPQGAAARGIYGDLYIKFTIKKNGRLSSVELARTSGYRDLDNAAIQALKDADPFWPLPDDWGTDEFTITGHFIYTLYGLHIR